MAGVTAGRELYDVGWRQGSRIPVRKRQAYYAAIAEMDPHLAELPSAAELVLTTQDCDLVKPADKLPYLEAIACCSDRELAKTVRLNSVRYFVLEPAAGAVADRAYAVHLTRAALAELPAPSAPPCGGDRRRCVRFARWLGSRYDRIPIPDAADEVIRRPLEQSCKAVFADGSEHHTVAEFFEEIRVVGDLASGPPYVVQLVFLLRRGSDPARVALAIAAVIEGAGFSVGQPGSASHGVIVRHHVAGGPERLSLDIYQGSQLVWANLAMPT